jgi:DNA-binding transcriptional MocR family regulator
LKVGGMVMETSENLLTVRELAEQLNVSKNQVNYQCSKLDSQLIVKIKGVNYLKEEAQEIIKSALHQNQVVKKKETPNINRDQLKQLKDQLEVKDSQITQLYRLLDQQQQLTLQSNRQVEKLQLQLTESFEKDFPVIDVSRLRDSLEEQHKAFEEIKKQLDQKEKENQLLQEEKLELEKMARKSWLQKLFKSKSNKL